MSKDKQKTNKTNKQRNNIQKQNIEYTIIYFVLLHCYYVLVLAVNSAQFQILRSTHTITLATHSYALLLQSGTVIVDAHAVEEEGWKDG